MPRKPTGPKATVVTAADRLLHRELELSFKYLIMTARPLHGSDMARRVARRYRELTGFGILSHNGIQKR